MPTKKVPASRIVIFGLLVVTGLYVICLVGLTVEQRHLIYYPCTVSMREQQPTAAKVGFRPWENAKGELIGWFRASQSTPAARTILLLHGNAGCASGWFHYADGFQAIEPIDFYILEYPGYGGRVGKPTQSTILLAADEAFASLRQNCGLYVIGESLGTGPVCYLAAKHPTKVKGIYLVAPYNNMAGAAGAHLPLFPVNLMLKDKYPSDQWLKDYRGPMAVLLGGSDSVIPSGLGRSLFDGYQGPKKLWFDATATHDDLHAKAPESAKEIIEFWSSMAEAGK